MPQTRKSFGRSWSNTILPAASRSWRRYSPKVVPVASTLVGLFPKSLPSRMTFKSGGLVMILALVEQPMSSTAHNPSINPPSFVMTYPPHGHLVRTAAGILAERHDARQHSAAREGERWSISGHRFVVWWAPESCLHHD